MRVEDLPLADIMANDSCVEIVEDHRERYGYVLIKCPNDDGSGDHALHVCNPWAGKPAMAYCLSRVCRRLTTLDMLELHGGRIGGWSLH
ncbi:MAG TPA: hypothetical protein VNK52_14370 [Hyphomicrobiaceae bacterium]|nr:hypothetical protein [Hyphomicrobiaceae bacterium]